MKKLLSTLCVAAFASYAFAVTPLKIDAISRIKHSENHMPFTG